MARQRLKILKALADSTRLKLLERIGKGEVCACALPRIVKTSQPAVSQHLVVLLDAGLAEVRSEGVKRLYRLSPCGSDVLKQVAKW